MITACQFTPNIQTCNFKLCLWQLTSDRKTQAGLYRETTTTSNGTSWVVYSRWSKQYAEYLRKSLEIVFRLQLRSVMHQEGMPSSCGEHSLRISLNFAVSCMMHRKILNHTTVFTSHWPYSLHMFNMIHIVSHVGSLTVQNGTDEIKLLISSSFVIFLSLGFSFS
jgi:hypothetical protein